MKRETLALLAAGLNRGLHFRSAALLLHEWHGLVWYSSGPFLWPVRPVTGKAALDGLLE